MSSTNGVERGRQFVDTNVLVYSFDGAAADKRGRSEALLRKLWSQREGCLSMQVLQELFVTLTGKLRRPLSRPEAAEKVTRFAEWHVHTPGRSDLLSAMALCDELRVSFWDAMILQSARRMECRLLWTEDLNHGQTYAGVTVRNPFLDLVMEDSGQ